MLFWRHLNNFWRQHEEVSGSIGSLQHKEHVTKDTQELLQEEQEANTRITIMRTSVN